MTEEEMMAMEERLKGMEEALGIGEYYKLPVCRP